MGDNIDLTQTVTDQLAGARDSEHGRSAQLIAHDGPLRQTVIALREGAQLQEHNAPPAASVQVLQGRIRLEVGSGSAAELAAGEMALIPHERHAVLALADSVFLLTTVTSVEQTSHS
ncbi:hypothetical protein [Granulicoccus phenolivorans]|uniref:hypothetical protein n=1 Tax=Granulicoccus phenolivorans TaxID=266854 RepID=UPI0003F99FDB|nr:hypothetical protein [Granulicoccus phenolivorans]